MLKRAKAEAQSQANAKPAAGNDVRELSQSVLNSSHQIWLAGLGAFSRAQAEGMKVFEALVRQGQELETRTRRAAADTATAARDVAAEKAKEMQKMAGGTWDKLEQVFEDRVARTLSKLGVYTQNDVKQLSQRVDALSEAVNRLIRASESAPGAATARHAKRPATKRASTGSSSAASAKRTKKRATRG
ncbi:MAG TPA: phasin family protein [Casimicrobiaceae bacterium]|nr:phasin family protein [Casimicrobiaceae bacterium]